MWKISLLIVFATVVVDETCVVVAVNEQTKGVNKFEITALCVVALLNTTHILTITEHIVDGVVHWVVEKASDVVLVGNDIGRVAVKNLTLLEDARRGAKFRPEVFLDFGDGVDADAIEAVGAYRGLDPDFKGRADP